MILSIHVLSSTRFTHAISCFPLNHRRFLIRGCLMSLTRKKSKLKLGATTLAHSPPPDPVFWGRKKEKKMVVLFLELIIVVVAVEGISLKKKEDLKVNSSNQISQLRFRQQQEVEDTTVIFET